MNYSLFDDVLKRREEGRSRKEKTTGSHIRLPPQKYGSRSPLIMLAVTDYQHCVETQDRRLEDPETGSAPPSYSSVHDQLPPPLWQKYYFRYGTRARQIATNCT